jgi:PhzF family phenazine biosynthesis protein
LFPPTVQNATAKVRIFTPTFEMPFAGHPTLGSAHVVRTLLTAGDKLHLEMKAGVIPVDAVDDLWTLSANAPTYRAVDADAAGLAAMLVVNEADIAAGAMWVDTGSDQLVIPLTSAEAVRRVAPNPALLAQQRNALGRAMAYVFAPTGAGTIESRFFFLNHGSVVEDPGTGSATANLGGWMLKNGRAPGRWAIQQGAQVKRPCHIELAVSAWGEIQVGGRVREIGRGVIQFD